MRYKGKLFGAWLAALLLCGFSGESQAATTNFVSPVQSFSCTSSPQKYVTALTQGTGAFTCTQPQIADLQNIAADTVLGNNTGSSAAVIATVAPVLGVAGTSTGSIGLSSSGGGTVTLGGGTSAITSYTIVPPVAVPTVSGQAWTSTTGGVGSWTTVRLAQLTVTSNPTSPVTLTSANDGTLYQISNSTSVTFNLTSSLAVGDNWCFAMQASTGAVTVADNSVGTATITMGNVTGTSGTGTLVGQGIGSVACIYIGVAGANPAAIVYSSEGAWNLT